MGTVTLISILTLIRETRKNECTEGNTEINWNKN